MIAMDAEDVADAVARRLGCHLDAVARVDVARLIEAYAERVAIAAVIAERQAIDEDILEAADWHAPANPNQRPTEERTP